VAAMKAATVAATAVSTTAKNDIAAVAAAAARRLHAAAAVEHELKQKVISLREKVRSSATPCDVIRFRVASECKHTYHFESSCTVIVVVRIHLVYGTVLVQAHISLRIIVQL
jgi:hypothetical protein